MSTPSARPRGRLRDLPVFEHEDVLARVSPADAIERVRSGFVKYAQGDWVMPPKIYLDSSPYGDFRAMPASGEGVAVLKWITSFPENPAHGLPAVTGVVIASDARTGEPLALVDARAVTALRTGAVAAVATSALARSDSRTVGLIGCGLHGRWAALCLAAAGYGPGVCADVRLEAAQALAEELGWEPGSPRDALACDIVTTVTAGRTPVISAGDLRPGLHLNALGADGPGKAELELGAVARCTLFCDDWEQASHGGELAGAVEHGLVTRDRVTELGEVLTGVAPGRSSPDVVTLFDSTGLAIQDLAIVLAVID